MVPLRRLVLLVFALPFFARAQNAPPPPPAQTAPPIATDVVVTAAALPADQDSLGIAATVIDRFEIERSQVTTAQDLLRTVPGLDIVQSGGPGSVTSAFLRGTNSTQTLVLVDGAKLNSPFFGAVDFSSLDTANVERIEVVRGPFSALYGSEAIGGVIQILTRKDAPKGFAARGTLAGGNDSAREGTVSASFGADAFTATAGFRRSTVDGTLPNDFFSVTNASGAVDVALGDDARAGLVVRRDDSKTGVPLNLAGQPSPSRTTTAETTTVSLPVSVHLGGTLLEAAATYVRDRPNYSDPDDPYGFTFSRTDAERYGGRLVASRAFGAHHVALGADYDHTSVENEDTFAPELHGEPTRTWSVFAEDRITLIDQRLVATLGVRHDDHSTFGGATNPRVTLSYRLGESWRLRAAGGGGFRSPSTGELYYPFSGNHALEPERSVSFEAGAEYLFAADARAEITLFTNSIRDLIEYDYTTGSNQNIGRARTRGVEAAVSGKLSAHLALRASYTYLDAEDTGSGLPLLRRPSHRASLTAGWGFGMGASAQITAFFVGKRDDVDAITFARVEDPSYVRLDLAGTGPRFFEHLAPFVRVTNLLDRDYSEVAGFPAPGIRFVAGVDVGF